MSEKKEEKKKNLYAEVNHKIIHAKTLARITDKDVYVLSKAFFAELLDLDYEFTHEELIEELKKTYMEKKNLEQAVKFIIRMGKMEFTSNEFTHEELKEMLDELHEILKHLVHEEETKIKWYQKLKNIFQTKKSSEEENIDENDNQILSTDQENINKLKLYLQDIKKGADAKTKYQEAIKTYELLSEKAKIDYYEDLLKIYHRIKQ